MILPIGDSPNPRGVPVMTYLLLAANVTVYVLITLPLSMTPVDPNDPAFSEYARVIAHTLHRHVSMRELLNHTSAYELLVFRYGFRPAAPHAANLIYSLFLHGGF